MEDQPNGFFGHDLVESSIGYGFPRPPFNNEHGWGLFRRKAVLFKTLLNLLDQSLCRQVKVRCDQRENLGFPKWSLINTYGFPEAGCNSYEDGILRKLPASGQVRRFGIDSQGSAAR